MWKQKRDKKFRFFEQYKDPLTNKTKTISVTMKDDKKKTAKQAQIILNDRINKAVSKVHQGKIIHGITIEALLNEFSEYERERVKRSTYYNHQTMIRTILSIFEDDSLVENFTSLVLTEQLENLMYGERHLSSGYVAKYKYFLHRVFDYAVKHSYIKENPVDKVELDYKSPVSGQQIKNKFFDSEELEKFLQFAYNRNRTYGQLCEWLYLTGSRIGEATSLDFGDVYEEDGVWYVKITGTLEYNHVKIKDQKKSKSPKTLTSYRNVVLPKKAIKIYQERKTQNGGKGFIFCTSHGTPIQTSTINTLLRDAKKKLKINKAMSTHIFRHTHISKLAELGVPLYVIQQRVGHANSKITRQIYLHVTDEAIKKETPKLDKL